jgi:hypothetical protein
MPFADLSSTQAKYKPGEVAEMQNHQSPMPVLVPIKDAERRENRRISAPMTVVIGNTPYAIDNWSLDGMKIANYYGALQPPDHAEIKVLVPTAGPGALFQTKAKVNRYDSRDVSLAISFESLDILARATLNRYLQERMAHGQA